jgi:hypothetical protein
MEQEMDFFALVSDVGFPIAAALAAGYFVFLTLRFILESVTESVKNMADIITRLDDRVAHMNNDVVKMDTVVSNALGLKPDMERLSRHDTKKKHRD